MAYSLLISSPSFCLIELKLCLDIVGRRVWLWKASSTKDKNDVAVSVGYSLRMLVKESGEGENTKWEKRRELEVKLGIGLGLKLGFVPTFHFPVPRSSFDGAQSFVYRCLLFTNCDGIKSCDVFISQKYQNFRIAIERSAHSSPQKLITKASDGLHYHSTVLTMVWRWRKN